MKFNEGDKIIVISNNGLGYSEPPIGLKGTINYAIPKYLKKDPQYYNVIWQRGYARRFSRNISEKNITKYINKPIKKKRKIKISHSFKVGDIIQNIKTNKIGRIRYIGILKGVGISETSIWTEWDKKWNQLLLPIKDKNDFPIIDGQLEENSPLICKLMEGKEKLIYLNKYYDYMFKQA